MCYDSSEQLCLEGGVTILCAIYTRLSKEDEDKRQPESESIQNQKSLLISYAVERGGTSTTFTAMRITPARTVCGRTSTA